MNKKIICEKCGAEMLPIDSNKPVGMTCPHCGWGWATTYIDPLQNDDTTHIVSLAKGNIATRSAIKIVAKISNKNYVQAKKVIENSPANVYVGKAVQVKDILILLESQSLSYTVTPKFPYPLSKKMKDSDN